MSLRKRLCLAPWLLLVLAVPAAAQAGYKVAVMEMEGKGAAGVQAAFLSNLGGGHTLVTPEEVSAIAQRLGLGTTCIGANIPKLASTLQVQAVICGDVERKRLVLTVYNGADGKLVQTVKIKLRRRKLTRRALARARPQIEAALASTAAPVAAPVVPSQSADPLQQALNVLASPVASNRIAALSALARLSNWTARRSMACTLLNDKDLSVRKAAAAQLGKIHDLAGVTAMRAGAVLEKDAQLKGTLRSQLMGLRQRVDALAQEINYTNARKREAAAHALAMGAYPQALGPLLKAMQDSDPRVRLRAVEGLRQFAKPTARAALRKAIQDTDATVQQTANTYIQEHQRLAGWRAFYRSYMRVIKHTRSKDAVRRLDSVVALGVSTSTNAVKPLSKMLLSDPDENVRVAVAWTLVLLGKKRGEAAMRIAADNDSSPRVQQAIKAYLAIASANANALLRELSDTDAAKRRHAAAMLSLRPTKTVRAGLVKTALCDPDTSVRAVALRGLARGGDPLSLTTIKLLMFRDPAVDVQRVATMMYVLVGWEEAAGSEPKVVTKTRWDTEDPNKQKHATIVKKEEAAKKMPEVRYCPLGCRALQARVGGGSLFVRNYSVENPTNDIDGEGLTSLPVGGFNLGVEVYPATWFTKSWLSNFGMGLSYAQYFGLQWTTKNDPDTVTDITHQVFTVDFLRVRWQPARRKRVPTLYGRFGLRYMGFSMNDEDVPEAHIPDISATSLSVGVAMSLPIRSSHLLIGIDYLPMMSWGEVTEDDEFGSGSGMGLLGTVGFGGPFSKLLGWRVELTYTLYLLELDRVDISTRRLADSVVDMYFHGRFSLTFNL